MPPLWARLMQGAAFCRGGLYLLAAVSLSGCVNGWFQSEAGYDAKPLTVETVSLFNQRTPSRLSTKNWKGDWIFRRDRLVMIDQDLRNTKPDLLLMQEVVERLGETAEADRSILMAGALADYGWRQEAVQEYADTQEAQLLAVAAAVPLKLPQATEGAAKRETWAMGTGGYLMATTIDFEDQPLTVFNVQMPELSGASMIWYNFIEERILAKLKSDHLCPKRLIVGGFMPGDVSGQRLADFIRRLQLKDAASGFCQMAGQCFTATPANELFMATIGEETPARTDRIFVHSSAIVYLSSRTFEEMDDNNHYAREYGLERLFATQRYGWRTQVRLAKCTSDELDRL